MCVYGSGMNCAGSCICIDRPRIWRTIYSSLSRNGKVLCVSHISFSLIMLGPRVCVCVCMYVLDMAVRTDILATGIPFSPAWRSSR